MSGIMSLTTFTQYKVVVTILLYLISVFCRKICNLLLYMGEHFIARNGTKKWAKNKTKICSTKENNFKKTLLDIQYKKVLKFHSQHFLIYFLLQSDPQFAYNSLICNKSSRNGGISSEKY